MVHQREDEHFALPDRIALELLVDTLAGYRSLRSGPVPEIQLLERPADEQKAILDTVTRWLENTESEDICLATRTNHLVERYIKILDDAGIRNERIKTEASSSRPGVRVTTMHRLKGLEFKNVLLCGVQDGQVPLSLPDSAFADESSIEDHEQRERCLFYVASTRARDELVVTGFGKPSSFLSLSGAEASPVPSRN